MPRLEWKICRLLWISKTPQDCISKGSWAKEAAGNLLEKGRFTPASHSGWTGSRKQTEEWQGLARPQENVLIISHNYNLLCAAFKFGLFLSKPFILGKEMQSTEINHTCSHNCSFLWGKFTSLKYNPQGTIIYFFLICSEQFLTLSWGSRICKFPEDTIFQTCPMRLPCQILSWGIYFKKESQAQGSSPQEIAAFHCCRWIPVAEKSKQVIHEGVPFTSQLTQLRIFWNLREFSYLNTDLLNYLLSNKTLPWFKKYI